MGPGHPGGRWPPHGRGDGAIERPGGRRDPHGPPRPPGLIVATPLIGRVNTGPAPLANGIWPMDMGAMFRQDPPETIFDEVGRTDRPDPRRPDGRSRLRQQLDPASGAPRVPQSRTQPARIQPQGARPGARRASASARAPALPDHLEHEPRRVLRGSQGLPSAAPDPGILQHGVLRPEPRRSCSTTSPKARRPSSRSSTRPSTTSSSRRSRRRGSTSSGATSGAPHRRPGSATSSSVRSADPHPGRAGPLAPLPEDPQQEPELHRPRRGRGRLRARGRHRRRSGPRTLPRLIAIPRDVSEPDAVGGDGLAFVMLSSVVHAHIESSSTE